MFCFVQKLCLKILDSAKTYSISVWGTHVPKPLTLIIPFYVVTLSGNLKNRCPEPNIPNGVRIGNDFNFGAEVTFECDKYHYMIGDYRRICLECGRWSGKKAICQRSHLPPPRARASTTFGPYAVTGSTGVSYTYPTQSTPKLTLGNEVPNPTQP